MWHIKPDRTLGKCTAKPGNCPYGEDTPHFKTLQEGVEYLDEMFYDNVVSNTSYLTTKLYKEFTTVDWETLEELPTVQLEELSNMIDEAYPPNTHRIVPYLQQNILIEQEMKMKIASAIQDYSSVRDSIDDNKIKRAMLNYYPEDTLNGVSVYSEMSPIAKTILQREFIDDFVDSSSFSAIQDARNTQYASLENSAIHIQDRNYLILFREKNLRKILEKKGFTGSAFERESFDESKVLVKGSRDVVNTWVIHDNIVEQVVKIKNGNLITEKYSEISIENGRYEVLYDDSKQGRKLKEN